MLSVEPRGMRRESPVSTASGRTRQRAESSPVVSKTIDDINGLEGNQEVENLVVLVDASVNVLVLDGTNSNVHDLRRRKADRQSPLRAQLVERALTVEPALLNVFQAPMAVPR